MPALGIATRTRRPCTADGVDPRSDVATLQVQLVAVERMIWSGEASMVIARTTEGELGVLPGHAPFMTSLKSGAASYQLYQYYLDLKLDRDAVFFENRRAAYTCTCTKSGKAPQMAAKERFETALAALACGGEGKLRETLLHPVQLPAVANKVDRRALATAQLAADHRERPAAEADVVDEQAGLRRWAGDDRELTAHELPVTATAAAFTAGERAVRGDAPGVRDAADRCVPGAVDRALP